MVNRNLSSTSQVNYQAQKKNNQERKLRTRTLIQCGGLLKLSGLLEVCEILEGEDLQRDLEGYEKAAILLGILLQAREDIENINLPETFEGFKKSDRRLFKQSTAKVVY